MSQNQNSKKSVLDKCSVKGKNIVITGGNRGLGFNFPHDLAQVGANIAAIDVNDKSSESFSELKSFGGIYEYYQADVTNYNGLKETIERIYQDFGSIDGW